MQPRSVGFCKGAGMLHDEPNLEGVLPPVESASTIGWPSNWVDEILSACSGADELLPLPEPQPTHSNEASPVMSGRPEIACWGAELKALFVSDTSVPCDRHFVPGKGHMKNKFCSRCHQQGFEVPARQLCVPPEGMENTFVNSGSAGLWTSDGAGVRFRRLNHTKPRSGAGGPPAILFATPPPALEWAPTPAEWLSPDGRTVHIVIAGGTLAPRSALTRPHGSQALAAEAPSVQTERATSRAAASGPPPLDPTLATTSRAVAAPLPPSPVAGSSLPPFPYALGVRSSMGAPRGLDALPLTSQVGASAGREQHSLLSPHLQQSPRAQAHDVEAAALPGWGALARAPPLTLAAPTVGLCRPREAGGEQAAAMAQHPPKRMSCGPRYPSILATFAPSFCSSAPAASASMSALPMLGSFAATRASGTCALPTAAVAAATTKAVGVGASSAAAAPLVPPSSATGGVGASSAVVAPLVPPSSATGGVGASSAVVAPLVPPSSAAGASTSAAATPSGSAHAYAPSSSSSSSSLPPPPSLPASPPCPLDPPEHVALRRITASSALQGSKHDLGGWVSYAWARGAVLSPLDDAAAHGGGGRGGASGAAGWPSRPPVQFGIVVLAWLLGLLGFGFRATPWFHGSLACLAAGACVFALFGPCVATRLGCVIINGFPAAILLVRAVSVSAVELAAGLEKTLQSGVGLGILSSCIAVWLGSQPDAYLTTTAKLVAGGWHVGLRILALLTMALRTGSAAALLVLLYSDLPFCIALAVGFWIARGRGRTSQDAAVR